MVGLGTVWGAGKGLVFGGAVGVAKGAVALADKGYETVAPAVANERRATHPLH